MLLQQVADMTPLMSEEGGSARLQLAVALDSLSRTDEAKKLYQSLARHPNIEYVKRANRMLWGMTTAAEFMKADKIYYNGGMRVRKTAESCAEAARAGGGGVLSNYMLRVPCASLSVSRPPGSVRSVPQQHDRVMGAVQRRSAGRGGGEVRTGTGCTRAHQAVAARQRRLRVSVTLVSSRNAPELLLCRQLQIMSAVAIVTLIAFPAGLFFALKQMSDAAN